MATDLLDFTDDVMLRQAKMASKLFQNASKYHEYYAGKVSECDLQISDILHYLENVDTSGADYLKAGKKLKELRKARRKAKQYMDFTGSLINNNFKQKTFLKYLSDPTAIGAHTYKVRTNVLKEVFGYGKESIG